MSDGLIFFINLICVVVAEAIILIVYLLYYQNLAERNSKDVMAIIISKNHLNENCSEKEMIEHTYNYYSSDRFSNRASDLIGSVMYTFYWLFNFIMSICFIATIVYLCYYSTYTNGGSYILWIFVLIDILKYVSYFLLSNLTHLLTNRYPGEAKIARKNITLFFYSKPTKSAV